MPFRNWQENVHIVYKYNGHILGIQTLRMFEIKNKNPKIDPH